MIITLPKKSFVIDTYAVDVSVLATLPVYIANRAHLRPIRIAPDCKPCALLDGRAWPLCVDASGALAVFTGGPSFKEDDVSLPRLPLAVDLPFIEMPFEHTLDPQLGWKIERNQFGVYVFLNARDETVERVVQFLSIDKKYNVISWGYTVSS